MTPHEALELSLKMHRELYMTGCHLLTDAKRLEYLENAQRIGSVLEKGEALGWFDIQTDVQDDTGVIASRFNSVAASPIVHLTRCAYCGRDQPLNQLPRKRGQGVLPRLLAEAARICVCGVPGRAGSNR